MKDRYNLDVPKKRENESFKDYTNRLIRDGDIIPFPSTEKAIEVIIKEKGLDENNLDGWINELLTMIREGVIVAYKDKTGEIGYVLDDFDI